MKDYLEKTCENLGIKLIFTNNKVVVLSAEIKNNQPIIRAHKVFKGCPYEVALALISYYSSENHIAKNEQILREYLVNNLISDTFKIRPVDMSFKKGIEKGIPSESTNIDNNPSLVEFCVSSMVVKDFWGKKLQNASDNSINPSCNDILELDIVVDPPVT
jgi:hypothetical protein